MVRRIQQAGGSSEIGISKRHHFLMASTEKTIATRPRRLWRRPGHRNYTRCKRFLEQKWHPWFDEWDEMKARKIANYGICLATVYRWRCNHAIDPSWRPWKTNRGKDRRIFTDDEERAISEFITENWLVPGKLFCDEDFREVAHDAYTMKYLLDDKEEAVRDFHASAGFISDFKKRNGFSSRSAHPKRRPMRRDDLEWQFLQRVNELLSNQLINRERIVNIDETFWRCLPADLKTWGRRGEDGIHVCVNGCDKDGITVVAAVTAARTKLPLSLIASGKTTACEKNLGDVSCHHKTHSETGWSTVDTFSEYLMFMREHYGDDDKIWLILDMYTVHRTEKVRQMAEALNIELMFIPPGQTDHFQPRDRAVFGVLKAYMRKLWRQEYAQNSEIRFTKELAVKLLIPAWERINPKVIGKGWAIFEH